MKLLLSFSVLMPLALLAQNPAPPPSPNISVKPLNSTPLVLPPKDIPPDAVILVIGDMKITREQFELLIQRSAVGAVPQADRRKMASALADIITLAAEARRQALDQTPYAKMNLDIVADQWLAGQLVTKEVRDKPLDDATTKKYYDDNQAQFDMVTARHILIRYKGSRVPLRPGAKDLTVEEALAKAQDLKKKLDAGADFAALAKAESDDTGSATNGGLLPAFAHGQMVPEFESAAFAATVGKATDPVKTAFGYHIILVTEHKTKPYDVAKVEIERKLKPEIEREYVEGIRTKTNVVIDPAYFGNPAPPPPTLGSPSAPPPPPASK
jgi:peptidyl-prolyl cis-trans isomerase C